MSVKVRRIDLARESDVLSTRRLGRKVGRQAYDLLEKSDCLLLNFFGVEVASPPFLDELLQALRPATFGGDTGRLLLIAGLNDDVCESLQMVLERRKLVLATLKDDKVELLGGAEQLEQTLREAVDLGVFTAPELAERLAIKLPALHQRLRALTEAGAIARQPDATAEHGKRHTYTAPSDEKILREAEEGLRTLEHA
jgi:DNA-binding transcriptional ArsR family regulator